MVDEIEPLAAPGGDATVTTTTTEEFEPLASPARKSGDATVTTPNTEDSATRVMARVREDNKNVVRAWETREWEKARARIEAAQTRIQAQEDAGVKDPVKEYSRQLVAARQAGELSEQRVGQAEAEATIGGLDKSGARRKPAGDDESGGSTTTLAAVSAAPEGATAASIAAELRRWPRPPAGSGCHGDVVQHTWPLYHDHFAWLDEVASAYSFADAGEVLRHLIFVANGEDGKVKKLIFRVIRCLHCHSGTRAGHIAKRDKPLGVFDFQLVWLHAVQKNCEHPSVEKTVRVLVDYYRKVTSDRPGLAAELFWRRRADVTTAGAADASFCAYMPGVPGNYMLGSDRLQKKQ